MAKNKLISEAAEPVVASIYFQPATGAINTEESSTKHAQYRLGVADEPWLRELPVSMSIPPYEPAVMSELRRRGLAHSAARRSRVVVQDEPES